jgi:hypothetical protein
MNIITRQQALEQGLHTYSTGKPCKYGHESDRYSKTGICVACTRERTVARAKAAHGGEPKPARLTQERFELRIRKHFGDRYDLSQAVYKSNGEKVLVKCIKHQHCWMTWPSNIMRGHGCPECDRDRKRVDAPLTAAEVSRRWRNSNPHWLVTNALRQRVYQAIKAQRSYKGGRTQELIGCSYEALRRHLAAQFLPGMSWENHGEWEIDHIRPCASFDLTNPVQQRECFHYSNLQPLWRRENRRKGARLVA